MKKHLSTIIFILIFLIGLAIFLYPTISNLWNEHLNSELILDYVDQVSSISSEEQQKLLLDARAYNEYFYDRAKRDALGLSYDSLLNIKGDGIMGYLEIPKISVSLVIYHGTDEPKLQNGIGHVETSALPVGGNGTHCVLAGHTGLPSAKLLTNLDQLEAGDVFFIHVLNEVLEYRVTDLAIVEPDDTALLKPETGKDLLTIVTCTPYGINSHRLLVRGIRSTNAISVHDSLLLPNELEPINSYLLIPVAVALPTLSYALYRWIRSKRKKKGGEPDQSEPALNSDDENNQT